MPTAKEIQDATAETKVAQALAVLPAKPLANNRLRLICASSSDIGNRFAAVMPTGTSFAAALDPAFWSNVCSQLRIGDVIEIHSDTRGFYGTVYEHAETVLVFMLKSYRHGGADGLLQLATKAAA